MEPIEIPKQGVLHKFVPGTRNEHFYRSIFGGWESDTFQVFDLTKLPQREGVALDIGAWVGTTAIWLSKNYRRVIAVEADVQSVEELRNNLSASGCDNVDICDKAIYKEDGEIVFGGRNGTLNESISTIKTSSNSLSDYRIQTLTLSSILKKYEVNADEVKFIKCDIESGEEHIMEELFQFVFDHNINLYLSFHYSWFQSSDLSRFQKWFDLFKWRAFTSDANKIVHVGDIVQYIQQKPFGSILFAPTHLNMSIVIPAFNNYTFVKNMVSQLEKFTPHIVIADNASTYAPLLDYYDKDCKYRVVRFDQNHRHEVLKYHLDKLGLTYVHNKIMLTDPDLQFNPNLPSNFIECLFSLSEKYKCNKIGFALDLSGDIDPNLKCYNGMDPKQWEAQFWTRRIEEEPTEMYCADIDTTFCMWSLANGNPSIRVAGKYTAQHLPWLVDFHTKILPFLPGEWDNYRSKTACSCWVK